MDDQRREEIRMIVDRFRNLPYSDNLMKAYCNLKKIKPITENELSDYTYQVGHDEKMSILLPGMVNLLMKVRYVPMFAATEERKGIEKANGKIHTEICELIEEQAIPFLMLDKVGGNIARILDDFIVQAGNAIYNKAMYQVILPVMREKFGADFNSKHSKQYAIDKEKGK